MVKDENTCALRGRSARRGERGGVAATRCGAAELVPLLPLVHPQEKCFS